MKKCVFVFIILFFCAVLFAQQAVDFEWKEDDCGGIVITGYVGTSRDITIPYEINGIPVIAIGEAAFFARQLDSVNIPDSVTSIGDGAFYHSQLTDITIPNNVTSIGSSAFAGNQLFFVTIPDSVAFIGRNAFAFNPLLVVIIGANVSLDYHAFGAVERFNEAYNGAGRLQGMYTRSDISSTTWTRK